jgi:hypothetical protein
MADWGVKVHFKPLNDISGELRPLIKSTMADLAKEVHTGIVDSIAAGDTAWPPLSETTKMISGSDRPFSSGELARSIRTETTDDSAVVGILIPKGDKGNDMEIASNVAESGATIKVTEKMRKFFAAKGRPLRKTTSVIMVPPRPVFSANDEFVEGLVDEKFEEVLDQIVEMI